MTVPTHVLLAHVEQVLGPVTALHRTPSPWASTASLEDVRVDLATGGTRRLVLKTGGRATARELVTYRDVLARACLGTPDLVAGEGAWLLLAAVPGAPLWQSDGPGDWCATAAWLARAHASLAPLATRLPRLDHDPDLARAVGRCPPVAALADAHARAVHVLSTAPPTVVHGELFPSNVLVHDGVPCVVDWETAGSGAGLLDLAALCAGWGPVEASRLAQAYGGDLALLPAARLVVAVRWLGEPRAEPDAAGGYAAGTDWEAEAHAAAAHLA